MIKQRFPNEGGDKGGDAQTLPMYLQETADDIKPKLDWIDIDRLRLWLQVCDSKHGGLWKRAKVAAGSLSIILGIVLRESGG